MGFRLPSFPRPWLAASLVIVLAPTPGEAQLFKRALVISHARILTMNGTTIEDGAIVIENGRITAIGRKPNIPLLPRIISARGRTITPGLVDVHSALGMTTGSSARGSPTSRAEDAFDRYAVETIREALRNGVTAVHVSSGGATGVHGKGAVIRLEPQDGGTIGDVLRSGADLGIDMGSSLKPIARLQMFNSIRKQFRDALEYRRDREQYEEELEEYLKKVSTRAEKKKKKQKDKESAGAAKQPPRRGGNAKSQAAKKDDKKDELKKPSEPRRRPSLEVLLRALDRELPVRIEAHRSEDLLNALDLASEFSLDLILLGATDAHLVARETAQAEAKVVLGSMLQTELYRAGRRWLPDNGARLSRAGVRWWVGSGAGSGSEARFVLMNAQLAARRNGSDNALELVTSRAAELLRVEKEIGRLKKNMRADLVIWSGDPFDPASRVEKVFVGGKLAFEAEGK